MRGARLVMTKNPSGGGGTGPTLRDKSANSGTGQVSPFTATIPSTVQVGDVLIATLTCRGTDVITINTPTGWFLVDSAAGAGTFSVATYAYRRVAQAGDAGSTLSITFPGGSSGTFLISVLAYSSATGVNAHANNGSGADGTSATSASVTTTVGNAVIVEAWGAISAGGGTNTITPPATQETSTAFNFWGAATSDQAQAAAGASGTHTASIATASSWAAVTIAVV